MYVLLGGGFVEEDFGGHQLHCDIFLGIFDSEESAEEARAKASQHHALTEVILVNPNQIIYNTGVDWYR